MTTLTRTNSRAAPPVYKDYVNFLASYKNGKKEDDNFSLSNSRNTSSSSSSLSSDVADFSNNTCSSYNAYLETTKNKKFSSVKPAFEFDDKPSIDDKPPTKKSEIFIEIQPVKLVSEISKTFEKKQERKSPVRSNSISSKINIFEKQTSVEKPKVAEKPVFKAQEVPKIETEIKNVPPPPPPPPMSVKFNETCTKNSSSSNEIRPAVKLQATLTKGPQTRYSVNTQNGTLPNEIDRNNPLVKKLVYGTLRGLYGAYHDKASDMLATLPKNMVVRSNGVQDRIEQIAANGDLDKLNGRVNPKLEQE